MRIVEGIGWLYTCSVCGDETLNPMIPMSERYPFLDPEGNLTSSGGEGEVGDIGYNKRKYFLREEIVTCFRCVLLAQTGVDIGKSSG